LDTQLEINNITKTVNMINKIGVFILGFFLIMGMISFTGDHRTETSNYWHLLALNKVDGITQNTKFGINPDIGTVSGEDVWYGGGTYTGQNTTTAEIVDIVSDDANDDVAGTGADTIVIVGLDGSWMEQYDTLAMNGTTDVATSTTWLRVNRAFFISAGSGATNAGTVTVVGDNSTNTYVSIPPGYGQSQVSAFTIPAGKTGIITNVNIRSSRANGAEGSIQARIQVRLEGQIYRDVRVWELTTGSPEIGSFPKDIVLPEKTDVKVFVDGVSDGNTRVSSAIKYYLYDNTKFNL
jgi:hypothetical protein